LLQASNQIVTSCKAFVAEGQVDDVCGQLPSRSVVEAKLDECLKLHAEYRRQFDTLSRQLGDRLSETLVFGKWDKFADRLRKIAEMFTVLRTYRRLRDSNVEGDDLLQLHRTTEL